MLTKMLSLNVVKQYCISKKPSRIVINLGFTALKLIGIPILPTTYSKIYKISLSTLRFFTKGLKETLLAEIVEFYEKKIKADLNDDLVDYINQVSSPKAHITQYKEKSQEFSVEYSQTNLSSWEEGLSEQEIKIDKQALKDLKQNSKQRALASLTTNNFDANHDSLLSSTHLNKVGFIKEFFQTHYQQYFDIQSS